MTFLAAAWLWVGGAAIAAVVALHFFARQRPRAAPLPTARFVPDIAARAPSLASAPSDPLVLLLRVLALAAAAVALARPQAGPARRPVARVVAVAASGTMRSVAAAMDSARALVGEGDTLVSVGERERGRVEKPDSPSLPLSLSPSISPTLISAIRAASSLRAHADSIELVLVSAFTTADADAATDSIRRLWPGRARLLTVPAAAPVAPQRIELASAGDDPLRPAVALLGRRSGALTRIVRSPLTAADSSLARGGAVVVEWPRDPAARWPAQRTDTVGAVVSGGVVVVAAFERAAALPSEPPVPSSVPAPRSPAFWVDGAPAATERALGQGCVRQVAIAVPARGDLVLRRSMRELVDQLGAPCGGYRDLAPLAEARLSRLRGDGPLMPARLAAAAPRAASTASAWLLGLAALLLVAEMFARARGGR